MAVRLFTARGEALMWDAEPEEEPVGYRRRLMGFLPPEERPSKARESSEPLGRSGDERPPEPDFWCSCGPDAEGEWIHGDPETYEEDEE